MNSDTQQPAYGVGDTSFHAAGGEAGIRRLVDEFYRQMDSLPEARQIRAMHPAGLAESSDKLARFLCGWLGGPRLYREKYGPIHIPAAHAHLAIGSEARDAWLLCMEKAIARQDYAPDFKVYLLAQLGVPAERCRTVP
ncbi:MAG TPA: group II truncated hemoglobin [Pseudomonadales bacterium]